MEAQKLTRAGPGPTPPGDRSPLRRVSEAVEEGTAERSSRQERPGSQARIKGTIDRCEAEQPLERSVQMSKANLGLEDTTEVGTDDVSIRAIIENPTDKVLPARHYSSEYSLVHFVLARPGKYQRGAVLEHGGEVSAVYTKTVGWTPTVRVET